MLKRTPFYKCHVETGARFMEFGGWEMPVSYSGILEETMAVRNSAGLFDLSHMGEIWVQGQSAVEFLNKIVTRDVSKLLSGNILYTLICREDGGIIDDILIYCIMEGQEPSYLLVVNASNTEKDLAWLQSHLENGQKVEIQDKTAEIVLLAIQGPKAAQILSRISDKDFTALKYYTFSIGNLAGINAILSRTGYTGEDGFEIYSKSCDGFHLWSELLSSEDILPVGLGARDVLRLEMRYLLYGNDISEAINPIEAGLSWAIDWSKENFIGKDALTKIKVEGPWRKLVGFVMDERGVPRHGSPIYHKDLKVGEVTSGTYSPSLKKEIGIGYLPVEMSVPGTDIGVEMRGKIRGAHVVKTPFVASKVKR